MTCHDTFTDGDGNVHDCPLPAYHQEFHNDGTVRWGGCLMDVEEAA